MTQQTLGTIWVCTDCYLMHCNGERDEDTNNECEPLSMIGDADVTAGMVRAEHDEDCPWHNGDMPDGLDCECETREFSWSSCEGCGTHLGGTRHAMTLWEVS